MPLECCACCATESCVDLLLDVTVHSNLQSDCSLLLRQVHTQQARIGCYWLCCCNSSCRWLFLLRVDVVHLQVQPPPLTSLIHRLTRGVFLWQMFSQLWVYSRGLIQRHGRSSTHAFWSLHWCCCVCWCMLPCDVRHLVSRSGYQLACMQLLIACYHLRLGSSYLQ